MIDYGTTMGGRCRRGFMLRYFEREACLSGPLQQQCDVCAGHQLPPWRRDLHQGDRGWTSTSRATACWPSKSLRKWRRPAVALAGDGAPYLVFNDATLKNLAAALPTTRDEFLAVKGTGETRWERFGPKVTAGLHHGAGRGETAGAGLAVRARRRPR